MLLCISYRALRILNWFQSYMTTPIRARRIWKFRLLLPEPAYPNMNMNMNMNISINSSYKCVRLCIYKSYSGNKILLREVSIWKLNLREWSTAPLNNVFIREKNLMHRITRVPFSNEWIACRSNSKRRNENIEFLISMTFNDRDTYIRPKLGN